MFKDNWIHGTGKTEENYEPCNGDGSPKTEVLSHAMRVPADACHSWPNHRWPIGGVTLNMRPLKWRAKCWLPAKNHSKWNASTPGARLGQYRRYGYTLEFEPIGTQQNQLWSCLAGHVAKALLHTQDRPSVGADSDWWTRRSIPETLPHSEKVSCIRRSGWRSETHAAGTAITQWWPTTTSSISI